MQFTAAQIAMLINGTVEGDANAAVGSFGKIEEAQSRTARIPWPIPNTKITCTPRCFHCDHQYHPRN